MNEYSQGHYSPSGLEHYVNWLDSWQFPEFPLQSEPAWHAPTQIVPSGENPIVSNVWLAAWSSPKIKHWYEDHCKEAIPPLAIPGHGCAPLGIPGAVTSVTVVTLVPGAYIHTMSVSALYTLVLCTPVWSALSPPHHHSYTFLHIHSGFQ